MLMILAFYKIKIDWEIKFVKEILYSPIKVYE